MKIAVYGAASSLIDESYKNAGIELGRKIAKRGHGLVFGGGANGMMGATAKGAYEEGVRRSSPFSDLLFSVSGASEPNGSTAGQSKG